MRLPDHAAHVDQPDLGANQEGEREQEFLSVRTLSLQAHRVAADMGLSVSGSRIRKVVRRFVREGRFDIDFRTWFVAYADPTGETAVRNVMRGAGE